MFIHTVYFWLKPGTPDEARDRLVEDCVKYLAACPTVKKLHAGKPAMTPRDVVDNSYAVGLTVGFADRAGHDAYQEDPSHHEFIERNKEHWERVQVYDYVE